MNDEPDAQAWYKSSQIRVALALFVPVFIRIAQHSPVGQWLAKYLGIDILTIPADQIVGWLMAAIAAVGGVWWIHKRVQAGKDPRSCAPEIIPPKIVQRITGNAPVVREPPPDEYADILEGVHPESGKKSEAELLADYLERQRRYGNLPGPIRKAQP